MPVYITWKRDNGEIVKNWMKTFIIKKKIVTLYDYNY